MKQPKKQDEVYLFKTIKQGETTINIYRPILTDEERKRREKQIMQSIGRILSKYPDLEVEESSQE